jgi:hypothetical protein
MKESKITIQENEILALKAKNKKKVISNSIIVIVWVLFALWVGKPNNGLVEFIWGAFNLISIILVIDIVFLTPLSYEGVKKSLIEKEEKRLKEEEDKKLNAEKRAVDQKESGSKLDNTEFSKDKFDGVNYLATIRNSRFKSAGILGTTHNSVNQSICLFDWEMQIPSVRLNKHIGLYATILRIEKESDKNYFIELLFRTSDLTNDSSSDTHLSAENCSLDILKKDGKTSIKSILVENIREENKRDLTHSMIEINQKIRFELPYDLLKTISNSEFEMRFSNFTNMKRGGDNMWEFTEEMRNALQKLTQGFISDIE